MTFTERRGRVVCVVVVALAVVVKANDCALAPLLRLKDAHTLHIVLFICTLVSRGSHLLHAHCQEGGMLDAMRPKTLVYYCYVMRSGTK
jgi:hypothetical protein